MASQHQNAVLDAEQERPMLEGALTFLVILTSLRIHLGESNYVFFICSLVRQQIELSVEQVQIFTLFLLLSDSVVRYYWILV